MTKDDDKMNEINNKSSNFYDYNRSDNEIIDDSARRQVFPQAGLLESSRTKWQHGDWRQLAEIDDTEIESDVERAKIALIVAAAHSHLGNVEKSQQLVRRAFAWGMDRRVAARVLISACQNSLGRIAALLGEADNSLNHFEAAISIVEPRADKIILRRTRQIRELAQIGLFSEAVDLLGTDIATLDKSPDIPSAKFEIIRSEISLLKHELTLSLSRGQIENNENSDYHSKPNKNISFYNNKATSQLGQDLWIIEKTNFKRNGYFIEFGATNGILLSNTFLLEKYFDWGGVCAEPNPYFYQQLCKNRKCIVSDACIGSITGESVEFILAEEFGTISQYSDSDKHHAKREAYRIDGKIYNTKTISLEDLLVQYNAPKIIDYLSIDTEGSEYDIIKEFPFNKWIIKFITIEHNFTDAREKIFQLLTHFGYKRTERQWDDWYERNTEQFNSEY